MFDFYKYIETFNAGDDKLMLDRFWVNDLEVWSGRGRSAPSRIGEGRLPQFLELRARWCPRTDAGAGSAAE